MEMCFICNGFEIVEGKYAGKTGIYHVSPGVRGLADTNVILCPACKGSGKISAVTSQQLSDRGFLPNCNPTQLTSKSIKECRSCRG